LVIKKLKTALCKSQRPRDKDTFAHIGPKPKGYTEESPSAGRQKYFLDE
jgi:hypothetical protein